MSIKPPLTDLDIGFAEDGFYSGFNKVVALASKIIIALIMYLYCFRWSSLHAHVNSEVYSNLRLPSYTPVHM